MPKEELRELFSIKKELERTVGKMQIVVLWDKD